MRPTQFPAEALAAPLRAAGNGDEAASEEAAEAELANLRAFAGAHVANVARNSVRFFTAQGIDREAMAALVVHQQAAAAGAEGWVAMEAVYRFPESF